MTNTPVPTTWSVRALALPVPKFARSRAFLDVAESTTDMITVLDAAGRRLYANPVFSKLAARSGHVSGSDPFGHIHPEDRSRVRKLFMRVLTDRRGRLTRYRIIDRSGRVRQVESHAHVIRDDGCDSPRVLVISWECPPAVGATAQAFVQQRAA